MSVQNSNKSRPKKLSDSTVKTLRLITKTVLLPLLSALIVPNVQKLPAGPINVAATANVTVLERPGTAQPTPQTRHATAQPSSGSTTSVQTSSGSATTTAQSSSGVQSQNFSRVQHVKIRYGSLPADVPDGSRVNTPPVTPTPHAPVGSTTQTSYGAQSSNFSNVGSVDLTFDSSTTASPKKSPESPK